MGGDSHHLREHKRINNADVQPSTTLEGGSTPATPPSGNVIIYYNLTTLLVEGVKADGTITPLSEIPEGRPELADGSLTSYTIPGVTLLTGTAGTFAFAADKLNYYPILVATAIVLDAIIINVTTIALGTSRVAIYNADADWQPTTLVVGSGVIDTNSAGVKTVAVTNTLAAGRYLMATNSDSAPVVRMYEGNAHFLGIPTTLGSNN